jgi:hypothetical protein
MKLATAVFALCFAYLACAVDVTGKWNATSKGPDDQDMQLALNFKQAGDKVAGTVEGPMGEMTISDGKVIGDAISFTVDADGMKIVHKGTVSGDEMKLKVEFAESRTYVV